MRFRKLRIAWSVICLLLCIPIIALDVRSHYWWDRGRTASGHPWTLVDGTFFWNKNVVPIYIYEGPTATPYPISRYGIETWPTTVTYYAEDGGIRIPLWLPVMILLLLATASWLPSKFSLRTLLLATTLVAVMLGLIVFATRR